MTPRALIVEALGTGLLGATVIGSAQMAATLTADNGLLVLANAAATGATLFVLITILGPISGVHFNPLVSLILTLRRSLPRRNLAPYVLAQSMGALTGMWLAHGMFNLPLLQIATHPRGRSGQILGEAMATFALILTLFGGHAARALSDTPSGIIPSATPGFLIAELIGGLASALAEWLFGPKDLAPHPSRP
ncbi:MAG: aquaporin [Pseudorhodobacter sp.]|nr:aquaporin [Pseudorhodobacter sp.]